MSSDSDEWETPDDLFQFLNQRFHFTVDVCANAGNAKIARFFTMARDGLKQPWDGVAWCNPPYTNHQAHAWIQKGINEVKQNSNCERVIYLLPVRTDTKLWHRVIMRHASMITFLEGRLNFKRPDRDHPNPAPFPSCIVEFEKLHAIWIETHHQLHPEFSSLRKSQYQDPGQSRLALISDQVKK